MVFDGEPSIGMPLPSNVSATLTFDPMTLKTYTAVPTHMTKIGAIHDSNASTKLRDIASLTRNRR